MIENDTKFIFEILIKKKESISPEFITDSLLRRASDNRVLYAFCKNLLNLKEIQNTSVEEKLIRIIQTGDIWLDKSRKTLSFIQKTLERENIPYLIVKTHKEVTFVTYDIDVFVDIDNYQKAKEVFRGEGMQIYSHDGSLGGRLKDRQVNCVREDLIMIDLHHDFTWQKIGYIDQPLVWERTEVCVDGELTYPTPSLEVEFILNLVHMLYERYYLTLLDFLTIISFIRKKLDWNIIFEQAEKYAWVEILKKSLSIISAIAKEFQFQEELSLPPNIEGSRLKEYLEFPYFFSTFFVMRLYEERLTKKGHIDLIAFAYYFYTRFKYYLSGRRTLPYFTNEAYGEMVTKL